MKGRTGEFSPPPIGGGKERRSTSLNPSCFLVPPRLLPESFPKRRERTFLFFLSFFLSSPLFSPTREEKLKHERPLDDVNSTRLGQLSSGPPPMISFPFFLSFTRRGVRARARHAIRTGPRVGSRLADGDRLKARATLASATSHVPLTYSRSRS